MPDQEGQGVRPAEQIPDTFHGIGPFDVRTGSPGGEVLSGTIQMCFLQALCQEAEEETETGWPSPQPCADGTGLKQFSPEVSRTVSLMWELRRSMRLPLPRDWPWRGVKPVVAVYSSFLQSAV